MRAMQRPTEIAVLGAGDLGVQFAHVVIVFGTGATPVFFDDTKDVGTRVTGHAVLGGLDGGRLDTLASWYAAKPGRAAVIAIGYRHFAFRAALAARCLELGIPLATLIAPNVWVDPSATVGEGSVIWPGCTISQRTVLGRNVFANANCVMGHDSQIGDHTILGPAVTLCGFTQIGSRCFLGAATAVIDHTAVGDDAVTGAGAVVVENVEPGKLCVGVPGRSRPLRQP